MGSNGLGDAPQVGRRAVLLGALALGGSGLLRAPREGLAPSRLASASLAAVLDQAYETTTADLTVRWRHLVPTVQRSGRWAGLIAGWPLDEGSGYAFGDVGGTNATLYVTGTDWNTSESGLAGAVHRPGRRGWAVRLNGRRWLACAPTLALAPDDRGVTVTASLWLDSLPTQRSTILSLGAVVAVTLLPGGQASLVVALGNGDQHELRSTTAVPTTTWADVAATVDPAAGALALWINGSPAGRLSIGRFSLPGPSPISASLGAGLTGLVDEATVHRGLLGASTLAAVRLLGLPRTFTQSSETIDAARQRYSGFKGSDPIPHPTLDSTVMTLRFPLNFTSLQGDSPKRAVPADFVPAHFGAGWRATSHQAVYDSPLTGPAGTFEAWYHPATDRHDPERRVRKQVFVATAKGSAARLVLATEAGRWRIDLTAPDGHHTSEVVADEQPFPAGALAHVAVAWGRVAGGPLGARLFVDGRPVGFATAATGGTTFDGTLALGGTPSAPSYLVFTDARVSAETLGWAGICPRGQAATESAGLDLRDFFRRPVGLSPLRWRPGIGTGPAWSISRRSWLHPEQVGDDPDANLAVSTSSAKGLRTLYHPDAYGVASSVEAGVAVDRLGDGWAGVFLRSADPTLPFDAITFTINPATNTLRLCRYVNGAPAQSKTLPYDFSLRGKTIYELTLTATDDGTVRGFVDGINLISLTAPGDWPQEGYAGLVTDGLQASFSAFHFTALTPATATSRTIATRAIRYGTGADATWSLQPFRWHKRRGLLPWQYTSKNPELPGNIAGADTSTPQRPIPAARWRSEDSANSDLIAVDGRVWYLMRGNPRIGDKPGQARVGLLYQNADRFDGIHFVDPNQHSGRVNGGRYLLSPSGLGPPITHGDETPNLNAPSSAYVGNGLILFLGRESGDQTQEQMLGETVFARFDVSARSWQQRWAFPVAWNADPLPQRLRATPEVLSLRDPESDGFSCVVFGQVGGSGNACMGTALVAGVAHGTPSLVPGSLVTSLQRPGKAPIYGFRVLFDNGIYYLHYNDGVQVPDWPDRFVLAAALDPHLGPWIVNPSTASESSRYFRRGSEFEPDNGAIWQGTMVKRRGEYYLYYENYHSIDDVDLAYENYGNPQAGSRVGYATG